MSIITTYAERTLKKAKSILLIDWPDASVPEILVKKEFMVFSYSPNGYSTVELVTNQPDTSTTNKIITFKNDNESFLVFSQMNNAPESVDIVNIFRPEEEHVHIIEKHVLPLHAKTVWLHPPINSEKTKLLADQNGLIFIEGIAINEVAQKLV